MAISNRFAIQRVFDIRLFDLTTGECLGYIDDLKQTNFSQEGTTIFAQGGAGNPKIIGFDHSKGAKLSCQSATYDILILGTQVGSTPITGVNTNIVYTDIITVTSNVATATYTPLGTAGSEVQFAYVKNSDGSLGTKFTQDSVTSANKFTVSGKTLTFNSGDITDATEIVIFYRVTGGSTTKALESHVDEFAKNVKMVAEGLARDICTGTDHACQIIFYKSKMSNSFDFSLSSDGNPAVQSFELDALKQCGSKKLWDFIIYETSALT